MSGTSSDKGRVASVPSACSSPGARIPACSGAPAGLENDGADGGRGDRMLSRTCGICRDGIPRELALWDPPLPVAAVVWLGGPSPQWGSARWVSAPQGPLGLLFPRAGTLGVTPRCPGVEGPGLGTALGVGRRSRSSCVWTVLRPEVQSLAPPTLLGTVLLSGSRSSVSCLA